MKRYLCLLLLGWMTACINVPEIEPSPPGNATDGGTSGTGDAGTQPSELAIKITEPGEALYTSTSATFVVDVSGGVPDSVQLLKDGEWLATLSAPWRYTWDTTAEAERSYAVTARAMKDGRSFVSGPVTVVVDRTHLQVATRTPVNGSTNVDYRTPIQVVFTKAVKATTISDTTVSFAVAGVLAEKTLTLSGDGKTLTIRPKTRPTLPASFAVGLSRGITDLAGNALQVPSTSWSFEVPDWYAFGGPLQALGESNTLLKDTTSLLDGQDNPMVAWSEQDPTGRFSVYVFRWDGKAFVPMGGALNATARGSAVKPTLAMGMDDKPVIAWQESDGSDENIYVRRWAGTTWQTVGTGALSAVSSTKSPPAATPARNPVIATYGETTFVAWDEVGDDGISGIYVWRSSNGAPFEAVGKNNGLVNAVPGSSNGSKPSLVVNSSGYPIVAFQEQTLEEHNPPNIYAMRFQANSEWAYAVRPHQGNVIDGFISGGLSISDNTWAHDCHLTIDRQNNLYLTWAEESYYEGPREVHVFRSTGPQSWERMGNSLSSYGGSSPSDHPKIKISPTGSIFIAWNEYDQIAETGYEHLFARRWDGNNWFSITQTSGINQGPQSSTAHSLVIDSLDRPVLTWFEARGSFEGIKGEYIYTVRHNN